jgi:peptide/nickel transport system ATP-binding protein
VHHYYLSREANGSRDFDVGRVRGAVPAARRPRCADDDAAARSPHLRSSSTRAARCRARRLSFDIAPGEILGVVGESGAGKSLTGASIIGLLDPPGRIAGGEIRFEGRRIDNLPYEEMRRVRGRSIGAIFQDPLTSLNPLYTVGQQLIETIRTHLDISEEEAHRRAVQLLEETGIQAAEQRINHYPHQFSGGMRQRVVIALALAAGPKLVVADEPTTALDVSVQAQIISLLKRLCRDHGAAVMLITHDMGVIAETCDRVAVMYAGRIAEIGPVHDVIHAPAHPYTSA